LPGFRQFTLDLSFQYIDQDQVRVGRSRAAVGAIPSTHDEVRTVNRLATFLVNYAPTDSLVLSAFVPYVSRYHEHLQEDELECWNFSELGDASLSARYRVAGYFWATAAVELPTGERRPENADGEAAETTLAPGSGSTDLSGGVVYQRQASVPTLSRGVLGNRAAMAYFIGATFRYNGSGTEDYRQGKELLANGGVIYPILNRLGVIAQINARFRGKDDVGDTEEIRGHTGGSFVFASPGLRVSLPKGLAVYGIIQIPVYQRVNGIQLTARYNLLGGIQARF
jgi:hypothetical protein